VNTPSVRSRFGSIVSEVTGLTRTIAVLAAIGATIAPASLGAVRHAVALGVPTLKPPVCTPEAPVVLHAGSAPRSALRLDLTSVASTRSGQVDLERVSSTTRFADGRTHVVDSTRTVAGALMLGPIASGHVPVLGHFRITTSMSGSSPSPRADVFSLHGYFDALNGGSWGTTNGKGGQLINDHLPVSPVGVGATWRVVNCQQIDATPARETRVYTLRSLAHGVMVATYRDAVEIDGAHVDLGTQHVGGSTEKARLLSLQGSSTGTVSLPLAHGLDQRSKTVTRFSASIEVSTNGVAGPVLTTTEVDTETDLPTG
jgi:hypothetical protein